MRVNHSNFRGKGLRDGFARPAPFPGSSAPVTLIDRVQFESALRGVERRLVGLNTRRTIRFAGPSPAHPEGSNQRAQEFILTLAIDVP